MKHFVDDLHTNGTRFAASNSYTPFILDLSKGYQQNEMTVKYQMGKHPEKTEMLITNE